MSSRRNFLKTTSGAVVVCVAGSTLTSFLESCTSIKFVSAVEKDGTLTVSKADFGGSFIVVKAPTVPFPFYLSRTTNSNENYMAVLMRCTHKQCEIKPAGSVLLCPCHYSEFSTSGKVLKGPASVDLEKFRVSQDDTNIYIHLK